MDVDTALAKVGGYRRWHLAIFSFLGIFGFMPLCWQGIIIIFLGLSPDHHCKVPEGQHINGSIPWLNGEGRERGGSWHQCEMYVNSTLNNSTMKCQDGWTYEKNPNEISIVTEWDLVCEKDYMGDLSQTIYQAGALLGEMFCSILVDKFGRKKVFLVGTFLSGVCGAVVSLSPNYIAFCLLRAITAIAVLAQCWAAETLMMEIFDSKRRAFAGIGLEGLWVLDYVLLAGLAYSIRNWRHLQLVTSLLVLPGMVAIWILPESPMWLVANGRIEEAEKVLQDMARYNGVKAPARLLSTSAEKEHLMSKSEEKPVKTWKEVEGRANGTQNMSVQNEVVNPPLYSWTQLFTDPTMRLQTIVSSLLWFANSVVYYAMILSSPSLPGDVYLNFLLGAIIEIPAYVLTYFIVTRWGRRIPTVIFHILAGVLLGVLSFIPSKTEYGTDLSPLVITVALLGKAAITISFAIIILYTKEIFPTNLRASSGGICSVPARVGTMAAPFASYAAKRIPWLPNVILAALSVIAAAITMILPETKDLPLPQTIEECKDLYEGHRICSCGPPKPKRATSKGYTDKNLNETSIKA